MKTGIAKKIFYARTESQLKQTQLSKLLGVSRQSIVNWENGVSKPSNDMIQKLSKALKKPVGYFFEEDLPQEINEPQSSYGIENNMLQVLMKLSLQIDALTTEIRNLKLGLNDSELKNAAILEQIPAKMKSCINECFKKSLAK